MSVCIKCDNRMSKSCISYNILNHKVFINVNSGDQCMPDAIITMSLFAIAIDDIGICLF